MAHYYTSITNNYLPKARILARSIRRHDAAAVFHLILCDAPPSGFRLADEPFDRLHLISELDIPDLKSWLFMHDVVELCTAAKGPALWKLLHEPGADQVFYFDPDVVVFDDLSSIQSELAQASVVLTPHQTVPEERPDAVIDNEICSLKHGVYNLGFLGVRPTDCGLAFGGWWRDRLLEHCFADIPNGLFTDQRWCDLAPALFDDVRIVRDRRYNVATWNLTHRSVVTGDGGQLLVEGRPLVFFHFSGFDSGAQRVMLDKYAAAGSPLFELHDWYVREMEKEGQSREGRTPCAFSTYADGTPIPRLHRYVYRHRSDLVERFRDPFAVGAGSLREWFERVYPNEATHSHTNGNEQAIFAVEQLKSTLTWRIGHLIAGPIERAMSRVPGLVPAVKNALRRGR